MKKFQEIESTYENRHGEAWHLLIDQRFSRALITGIDIDWEQHPVYGGFTGTLALSPDEQHWLTGAWTTLEKKYPALSVYRGQRTEFKVGNQSCYLTENVCPLCLKQKTTFDFHHCIASFDGGPDRYSNVLRTCRTCHVILTIDPDKEGRAKERAAFWHQVMHFGFSAFPTLESRGARHPDVSFYDRFPQFLELVESYRSEPPEEQDSLNQTLVQEARFRYQHFRDIGLGTQALSP